MNRYSIFVLWAATVALLLVPRASAQQIVAQGGENVFPALIHPGCLLLLGERPESDGAAVIVQSIPTADADSEFGGTCNNFRVDDRILSINGASVTTVSDFRDVFLRVTEDSELRFVVERDGENVSFTETRVAQMVLPQGQERRGVAAGDDAASNWVTAEEETGQAEVAARQPYELSGYVLMQEDGAVTVIMKQRGADDAIGLMPGDQIVSVNGNDVSTTDAIREAVDHAADGAMVQLGIVRNGVRSTVAFRK